MIDASIVICTFNRPALLARAVESCRAQATRLAFEIVVVDNSLDGNAAAQMRALAEADPRVRYVALPRPNISLARNAGIAAARGEYVAFLDDDEEAAPGWIEGLVSTARDADADCAFGPVRARFAEGTPPRWDPTGWYFTRFADLPNGVPVDVFVRPRQTARWVGTGNSLIRVAACGREPGPFDAGYGRTGGEDTEFFERMAAQGRRIVWCATASVDEFVPAERSSLAYMMDRKTRSARLVVRIASQRRRRPWLARAGFMVRGAVQGVAGLLIGVAARPLSVRLATRALFHAAAGWGMLTWWQARVSHD